MRSSSCCAARAVPRCRAICSASRVPQPRSKECCPGHARVPSPKPYWNPTTKAFSSEVGTGSREKNASNQESRAPFRFNRNGKGSRAPLARRIARRACAFAIALAAIAAGDAGAQSAVTGVPNAMQGFSQKRDQPIQIDAATLEMRDKKKEATFSGNVKVVQGDTTMTSKTLVVFYESTPAPSEAPASNAKAAAKTAPLPAAAPGPGGSSSIKRLEARGNVVVTQ